MKPYYHLAQVNVARAVAPLDDPRMADLPASLTVGFDAATVVWIAKA